MSFVRLYRRIGWRMLCFFELLCGRKTSVRSVTRALASSIAAVMFKEVIAHVMSVEQNSSRLPRWLLHHVRINVTYVVLNE